MIWSGRGMFLFSLQFSYLNATNKAEDPYIILYYVMSVPHAVTDLQCCDKHIYAWYMSVVLCHN